MSPSVYPRLFALTAVAALAAASLSPVAAMGSSGGGALPAPRGPSDSELLREQYKKAKRAIDRKDFAAAEALLADYVTKKPRNADAWNLLAYSRRSQDKDVQAMADYITALDIDPAHKGALEYQGELFLKLGNLPAAEANLARLAALCRRRCEERDALEAAVERAKDGRTSWAAPTRPLAAAD